MRGLFITGTDTGVGKTRVTCLIARHLRDEGRSVRVSKPVATGGGFVAGRCLSDDTRQLADAAGDDDLAAITPWTFREPLAPPVAARREGARLTLSELAGAVRRREGPGAAVLVEGVGGLLCPLTETETVADLAAVLRLPLIIVARAGLGTLNHTLLTVEVATARGLPVAGVIVNHTAAVAGPAEQTNAGELRRRLPVPLLAEVPYDPHAMCPESFRRLPWAELLGLCPPT